MKATFKYHPLQFIKPAGTSRGWLTEKPSWILSIENEGLTGTGEVSIIPGLSRDPLEEIEENLTLLCRKIVAGAKPEELFFHDFPAINFAVETALADLENGGREIIFPGPFSEGKMKIPINGLVWMGDTDDMLSQAKDKVAEGYSCIKIKVGALDFEREKQLLKTLRGHFPQMEIRLDANGAFTESDVFKKLYELSEYNIHSIEQPVKPGQYDLMQRVCAHAHIPVALDEELIAPRTVKEKHHLLEYIKPQYIILKPSLLGGFSQSEEWIEAAAENGIEWWATSALESNIGLNAIAQWVSTKNNPLPQGLGTGKLFTNNIETGLVVEGGFLELRR